MYPPTPPAITAMPMNHTVAPNERLGGSGGTATMSFFGEIRPSSIGATSVEGPAGCLHGGSGLNSVPGDSNGSVRSGRRPVPGAYAAGPCSEGLCSDGPPSDLSSDGPAPWGSPAAADMIPLAFARPRFPPRIGQSGFRRAGCYQRERPASASSGADLTFATHLATGPKFHQPFDFASGPSILTFAKSPP